MEVGRAAQPLQQPRWCLGSHAFVQKDRWAAGQLENNLLGYYDEHIGF